MGARPQDDTGGGLQSIAPGHNIGGLASFWSGLCLVLCHGAQGHKNYCNEYQYLFHDS
ncbi:MAG: hypothetical protein ABJQ44_13635 [Flavobacteriaceae bacterium]